MARANLEAVHPVLPSQDVATSLAFYVMKLGFKKYGQDSRADPKYAVVARDNVEFHLQWHDPDEWAAVERPMDPDKNPMPFDGKRLIYGGFVPLVELSGN